MITGWQNLKSNMRRNILIFIFAFSFSSFIWIYINLNQSYSIDITVPLKVKLSGRQALSSDLPSQVEMNIRGKGWDLLTILLAKNITYNLDLTGYKKDTKLSTLQAVRELLTIPSGVSVMYVYPDTLDIKFDNIQEKTVKIKNNITVIPKEGFIIIGTPKLTPDSVKITGAGSVISKIKSIGTEYKTFSEMNSSFTKTVYILDTLTNLINIEPKSVTISYQIELAAEKDFEDFTIQVKNIPEDKEVLIIPPKVTFSVRSGVDQLAKLSEESIKVFIEYNSIEKDSSGIVTPVIELPGNINLLNINPNQFKYIIKSKASN